MFFIVGKNPITKSSKCEFKWLTNLSLTLSNEVEQIYLQLSTFENGSWKENFLGIDFCQIDQNSQNSGRLVPQRFVFNKIDILKVIL